jgi:MoaA/NifB/PqqE/SkfB family radical SAM enzyme
VDESEHRRCHPGIGLELHQRRLDGLGRILEARRRAKGRRPRVRLVFPLNRANYGNVSARVALVKRFGVDEVSFRVFHASGRALSDQDLGGRELGELGPELRRAARELKPRGVAHNVDDYLFQAALGYQAWRRITCYAAWFQAVVTVDGDVLACIPCRKPLGSLRTESFARLWTGPAFREFRRAWAAGEFSPAQAECRCENCCVVRDNRRVNQALGWLRPFPGFRRGA